MQSHSKGFTETQLLAQAFLKKIKAQLPTETDPTVIKACLAQLNLKNFKPRDKHFSDFVETIQEKSISTIALIKKLEETILDNEPICQLFAEIEKNKLITDAEIAKAQPSLIQQINLLVYLEALICAMANSKTLASDIQQHIMTGRGIYYLPGNTWSNFFFAKELSIFERLKMISVDPAFWQYIFNKQFGDKAQVSDEDITNFITENQLSSWNKNINPQPLNKKTMDTIPGLEVNILEAIYEQANGHHQSLGALENAQAGVGLVVMMDEKEYKSVNTLENNVLPEGIRNNNNVYELLPELKLENTKTRVAQFECDKEWMDLYIGWNLLFVIAHYDSVFLPLKLLIPSVFSAKTENFKDERVASLFVIGNIFAQMRPDKNAFFKRHYEFANAEKIFCSWARINKEYSQHLVTQFCPKQTQTLDEVYQNLFGQYPTLSFAYQVLRFGWNANQFRATK